MQETLLLILLIELGFLLRPRRDWYVAEWRTCSDEKLCSMAFSAPPGFGFDEDHLSAYKLTLGRKGPRGVTISHKDGGEIGITQTAFDDLGAALQYFEKMKELFPVVDGFHKVYVWRIVARSRRKAIVLPPATYISGEGEVLQAYPLHLWFKPQKGE